MDHDDDPEHISVAMAEAFLAILARVREREEARRKEGARA